MVAQDTKWKVRYIHTVLVEADEYVGRLRWERSQRNVRASLILQKRKEGRRKGETLQLVVSVPAGWKFLKKVERVRDQTDPDDICELLAHWDYISLISYGGLVFEENVTEPKGDDQGLFGPHPIPQDNGRGEFEDDFTSPRPVDCEPNCYDMVEAHEDP